MKAVIATESWLRVLSVGRFNCVRRAIGESNQYSGAFLHTLCYAFLCNWKNSNVCLVSTFSSRSCSAEMRRALRWCVPRFETVTMINKSTKGIIVLLCPPLVIRTHVFLPLENQPSPKILIRANLKLAEGEVHLPQDSIVSSPCMKRLD